MLERFFPDLSVNGIRDINLDLLKKKNIKGLILDIDNTLVAMHAKHADENAVEWIESLKKAGFKICIVSNASKNRVVTFNKRINVMTIHRASKPWSKAFLRALKLMEISNEEAAVVGDQIFTDIYGGNKLNMFTILVKPIDPKEAVFIRLKRRPEKLILAKYKKKSDILVARRIKWKRRSALKRVLRHI